MSRRIFYLACLLALAHNSSSGQTSFKGLTPGKSTRAEVERVLGQPVNKVSETLVEYAAPRDPDPAHYKVKVRLYVQYRKGSPVVERIAILVKAEDPNSFSPPALYWQSFDRSLRPEIADADLLVGNGSKNRRLRYYGDPVFAVLSSPEPYTYEDDRVEYYSRELYESVVPKKGCTGGLIGDWDSGLGRMTITELARTTRGRHFNGTYSKNNGSFDAIGNLGSLRGQWKDDAGSGTLFLLVGNEPYNTLTGYWTRQTGKGPAQLEVHGRCVEVNAGRKP